MTQLHLRNGALAIALGVFYYWCLGATLSLISALVLPRYMPQITDSPLLFQESTHFIAVLLSAMPVAAALIYLTKEQATPWALVVGVGTSLPVFIPWVLPLDGSIVYWSFDLGAMLASGFIKVVFVPVLLVWVFRSLMPSNQPLHRDASGSPTAAVVAGERRR